jgi:hypothetical protein
LLASKAAKFKALTSFASPPFAISSSTYTLQSSSTHRGTIQSHLSSAQFSVNLSDFKLCGPHCRETTIFPLFFLCGMFKFCLARSATVSTVANSYSTFISHVFDGQGGAIQFNSSAAQFILDRCDFKHCHTTPRSGSVFLFHAADVRILSCIFENGSCNHAGGHIHIFNANAGTLVLSFSFQTGTAQMYGGVISTRNTGSAYQLSLYFSTFISCSCASTTADQNGGGLACCEGLRAVIMGCSFTKCSSPNRYGGGIGFFETIWEYGKRVCDDILLFFFHRILQWIIWGMTFLF